MPSAAGELGEQRDVRGDARSAPHADTPLRATPSAGGVEFGSALGLILGFDWPGWRSRWPRLGDFGGQTEVSQDALHHRRLLDQRDEPQPPVAAGTRQDIESRGINSAH